ncbi:MAG: sigma-70 family RNA polymerase sigma factor [Clostridia bacterium]|nr:MAG: sigma-70 family RNA polymerase sigma factor [Clostridia bacterium]
MDDLVAQARAGNVKALEELCLTYWKPVYMFLYYRVQNREEAEELTQEVFLRTLKSMGGILNPQAFQGYLYTVARHLLADRWRLATRAPQELPEMEVAAAGGEDPEEAVMVAERRGEIREALDSLLPQHQEVIRLRLMEGYSVKQTAALMSRSEGAVRSLQYRAVSAFREVLLARGLLSGRGDA